MGEVRTAKSKKKVALFLGSGFSAELGLPTTRELRQKLVESAGALTPEEKQQEDFVTKTITQFWKCVFGWKPGAPNPSLEDHFTQIDLAANTGHCLGLKYCP